MNENNLRFEVWVTLPSLYPHSEEQQLVIRLLRRSLPADVHLKMIQRENQSPEEVLTATLDARLADPASLPEYLLLIKESWVLFGSKCVSNLVHLLDTNPQLDCVLPLDQRGSGRKDWPGPRYNSLRSFEVFSETFQGRSPRWQGYDGREPFLYLVRGKVLRDRPLDDLFKLPASLGERAAIALNAYVHLPIDYYGECREDILDFIPQEVTSLLDIGCAGGNFGATVKAQRSCRVVGIELNPVVGEKARQQIDEVYIGDVLRVDLDERFQCVTCLDVIEHVSDPHRLMERICHNFLKPGGLLIASVPNVGHWSIVADLLAGRWDYVPIGLLCVSHLRFFTLDSLRTLFEEQGLEILHIRLVSDLIPESFRQLLEKMIQSGMEVDMENLKVMNYHIVARLPD